MEFKVKKKLMITLSVFLMILIIVGVSALASSNYGSSDDPLITLSYLTDTFMTQIMSNFDTKLNDKTNTINTDLQTQIKTLNDKLDKYVSSQSSEVFSAVNLKSGQTVTCAVGLELMLRSGSATASQDLSDLSGGSALAEGSQLLLNHLYITSVDKTQIAVSADCLILIRGSYTIT
jgi:hypothetical protein